MVTVKFKYRDAMSNWEWREQSCYVRSVAECKRIYGLGTDREYQIISVEEEHIPVPCHLMRGLAMQYMQQETSWQSKTLTQHIERRKNK